MTAMAKLDRDVNDLDRQLYGFDHAVLPGFVEGEVTYESHTFEMFFRDPSLRRGAELPFRLSDALIRVRHGGGIEVWRVYGRLVDAVHHLVETDQERLAFHTLWTLTHVHRDAVETGRATERHALFTAFVEGRLRKRKNRGQTSSKVWVEPALRTAGPMQLRCG